MMKKFRVLLLCIATFCVLSQVTSLPADDKAKSYYLIGNSLTWDTVPSLLDGDVQWHVDCGKSLPYIYAHPEMPCVKNSTLWPQALKEKQYDLISVQPHYGSTLAEDADTISKWVEMQPKARLSFIPAGRGVPPGLRNMRTRIPRANCSTAPLISTP
jgi:hypothetical protein